MFSRFKFPGIINCIILFLIIQSCPGCLYIQYNVPQEDLYIRYRQAVDDAKIAESGEICKNLVAVVPGNSSLTWDKATGNVLVVTWTNWDGYSPNIGKAIKLSKEVWVTVVPDIKSFCSNQRIKQDKLLLRLEQLLGLPPKSNKTQFVELWVSPKDLFRPSPDPEISDHEAELDFPESSEFIHVTDRHREWFIKLKASSYGDNGYPWTRLGYTYDWGNPESEIGLSEFVIQEGATVLVYSTSESMKYCR